MIQLVVFAVVMTSIWVLFDARSLGVEKGQRDGVTDMGATGWFFACLGLWLVAFPMYLASRPALAREARQPPARPQAGSRFCSRCGQPIRADATYCPSCGGSP